MSFSLQYDRTQQVLVVTLGAVVTEPIFAELFTTVEKFSAAENPTAAIVDYTSVESFTMSADFVRRMAARAPAMPTGRLRVHVAPKPDIYGMGRMFQSLRDAGDVHIVRTMEEAYALLKIHPPEFS